MGNEESIYCDAWLGPNGYIQDECAVDYIKKKRWTITSYDPAVGLPVSETCLKCRTGNDPQRCAGRIFYRKT